MQCNARNSKSIVWRLPPTDLKWRAKDSGIWRAGDFWKAEINFLQLLHGLLGFWLNIHDVRSTEYCMHIRESRRSAHSSVIVFMSAWSSWTQTSYAICLFLLHNIDDEWRWWWWCREEEEISILLLLIHNDHLLLSIRVRERTSTTTNEQKPLRAFSTRIALCTMIPTLPFVQGKLGSFYHPWTLLHYTDSVQEQISSDDAWSRKT